MDRWDVMIILAACYMAVMALVRIMARRRNQLVDQVREQIAEQHGGKQVESGEQASEN